MNVFLKKWNALFQCRGVYKYTNTIFIKFGGVRDVCTLCGRLKTLEDTWIKRLGNVLHQGTQYER